MYRCHYALALACLLFRAVPFVSAQPAKELTIREGREATALDAQNLAAKIDRLLDKRMADANVQPAPLADDSEFLRRVYLDLAGRIPTVAETRAFLADKQPVRRARVIDRLLAGPRYSTHFASVFRSLLIPEANSNFFVRLQQDGFENWLKKQLVDNAPYDRMTRDLLSGSVGTADDFGAEIFSGEASTTAYFAAKEYKPENLAAGAARIFLGVRVECAQCHDHPFAKWEKEQFWGMAAFFSGVTGQKQGDVLLAGKENPYKREIALPGSERLIEARFLDGSRPNWDTGATTRATFAEWVTSPTNPYFARSAVNRTWAYFFGTGLVEPVDEMIGEPPNTISTHPELLDLLATEFVQKQFDLKYLFRAVTLTKAYQRTSAGIKGEKRPDPTMFSRMQIKGLSPEQLFDSLATATGFRDTGETSPLGEVLGLGKPAPRSQFLAKFTNLSDRATMAQTSILQALTLMNGKVTADATSLQRSETLAALLDAPFLTTTDRVESLYLAAFSRRPSARELERTVRFINDAVARDADGYNHAVADVFWALLNSSEFVLNH